MAVSTLFGRSYLQLDFPHVSFRVAFKLLIAFLLAIVKDKCFVSFLSLYFGVNSHCLWGPVPEAVVADSWTISHDFTQTLF